MKATTDDNIRPSRASWSLGCRGKSEIRHGVFTFILSPHVGIIFIYVSEDIGLTRKTFKHKLWKFYAHCRVEIGRNNLTFEASLYSRYATAESLGQIFLNVGVIQFLGGFFLWNDNPVRLHLVLRDGYDLSVLVLRFSAERDKCDNLTRARRTAWIPFLVLEFCDNKWLFDVYHLVHCVQKIQFCLMQFIFSCHVLITDFVFVNIMYMKWGRQRVDIMIDILIKENRETR